MSRLLNVLLALDCFLFSLCTLGRAYPFESFSSAAYRAEQQGRFYGKFRPIIDAVLWFDPDHCKRAYTYAKLNLPEDMR
jgi:hypothetical protein